VRLRVSVAMDHRAVELSGTRGEAGGRAPGASDGPWWLMSAMRMRGLILRENGRTRLTAAGAERAAGVASARARWEEFVTRQAGVTPSHARVSGDLVEHVLGRAAVGDGIGGTPRGRVPGGEGGGG
jgi:hypothetical protein